MLKTQTTVAMTFSLLVAALVGIQLGTSAIGAVNPIFFTDAPVHPRDRGAAVDPREIEARRLARQAAAYDSFYDWNDGSASLRLACAGCTIGGQVAASYVPYFGSRESIAAEDERMRREIDARYEARLAAEVEREARRAEIELLAEPAIDRPIRAADGGLAMGGPDEPLPPEDKSEEAPEPVEPVS
jgi:hypothetical protein